MVKGRDLAERPQPPHSTFYIIPCPGGMAAVDEIQNLCQHLKEILFINASLPEKLEHHLSIPDQRNGRGGPSLPPSGRVYLSKDQSPVQGFTDFKSFDIPYFTYFL